MAKAKTKTKKPAVSASKTAGAKKPASAPKPKKASPVAAKPRKKQSASSSSSSSSKPLTTAQITHLIEVGTRFATDKLLDFATAALAKASKYPGFARFGLDAAWFTSMKDRATSIDAQSKALGEARGAALPGAAEVVAAIADGKAWRRDAATSVTMTEGLEHHFLPTGSSVPQLLRSMTAMLPIVGDARATPHGGGPDAKKKGQALIAALQTARTKHLAELAGLSPAARTLAQAKGDLYEDLARLARAARNVAPTEASTFATSSHLRVHRRGSAAGSTGATSSGATGATGATAGTGPSGASGASGATSAPAGKA